MKTVLKFSHILLSSLVVVLAVFCIYQIISVTQERYVAEKNQRKVNAIVRENYSFSQSSNNEVSLRDVEEMALERGFIATEDVAYIKVSGTEVVAR